MNSSTPLGNPPQTATDRTTGLPSPDTAPAPPPDEAKRALLERPVRTFRARLIAVFVVLCSCVSVVTVGAVVFLSSFKTKSVFLEAMTNYALEIQQARRL